jgi:hypothetical protein
MKKAIRLLAGVVLAGALAGCEWESTPSSEATSSSGYFVNFSGVYRGAPGRYLVSSYSLSSSSTTTGGGTSSGGSSSVAFVNENQGSASGSSALPLTKFGGNLAKIPVVSGSVTIFMRDASTSTLIGTFNDTGAGQLQGTALLEGVVPISGLGEINYATGAWYINLSLPGLTGSFSLSASYRQDTTPESDSSTVDTGTVSSGATGGTIYSFTVQQDGSSISIIDNNGKQYFGTAAAPVFTSENLQSSTSGSTTETVTQDGPVTMSFNATGTSAAGFTVNIVGSFNGLYTDGQRVTGRTISGTWIEVGGKTGDIYGLADDSTAN